KALKNLCDYLNWDCTQKARHKGAPDSNQNPSDTEDDRLHRVEAHKTVVLFRNVENDATDQRNASNRRSHVRRQTRRCGLRARLGSGALRGRRWNWLLIWHDLHTQNGKRIVKQSCFCCYFLLSLQART